MNNVLTTTIGLLRICQSTSCIAAAMIFPVGLVVGAATTIADDHIGTQTPTWIIDSSASTLKFSATVALPNGDEKWTFVAGVERWTDDIQFDSESPEAAALDVIIDMTSIGTGRGGFDQEMLGKAWLDAKGFTQATYHARGFERSGDNAYTAEGSLTLRGVAQSVPLSFELTTDGSSARAIGSADVHRLDFGIGKSAGPGLASTSVTVLFDIMASAEPSH